MRDFLVWLVTEALLEWFCFDDDAYPRQQPDAQGDLHSRVFPGLRLTVAPPLACGTATVLEALTGHESLNKKPPETSVKIERWVTRLCPFESGQMLPVTANEFERRV